MKRFLLLQLLIFLSISLVMSLQVLGDEPATLELDKECVIVGRIQGTDVMLYPQVQVPQGIRHAPQMARIKGFEILNLTSGEWEPITLTEEGYFCANVRMGKYELRGRDCEDRPYLIHRFNVPLHMAVNLGTFWVEASDPVSTIQDPWHNYERTSAWREYREGAGHVAFRLVHATDKKAYENCENWFAQCHEEVYEHFEKVMARR